MARLGGVGALPPEIRQWSQRKDEIEAKRQGPHELNDSLFVTNWLVLGAFPCPSDKAGLDVDYLQNADGETMHVPDRELEVATGRGVQTKWLPYVTPTNQLDFFAVKHLGLVDPRLSCVVYAACWLKAEEDTDCELQVSTVDDGYMLYLDHELLGEPYAKRWMSSVAGGYSVRLAKGLHLLLVKVDGNQTPPWAHERACSCGRCRAYPWFFGFSLRVTDPLGVRPSGITVWN